jgi:hypothetical protein
MYGHYSSDRLAILPMFLPSLHSCSTITQAASEITQARFRGFDEVFAIIAQLLNCTAIYLLCMCVCTCKSYIPFPYSILSKSLKYTKIE